MGITFIKQNKVFPEWCDSAAMIHFDGYVHAMGQARNAIFPSKMHYVFMDVAPYTRLYEITAPFEADAEMLVSRILPGKLAVISGTSNTGKVWVFDPAIAGYTAGSWYLHASNVLADTGPRVMAIGADANGEFFTMGGLGNNTIYKTSDLTNWSFVRNLPANMTGISAAASCEHKGKIITAGGATHIASPYSSVELYEGNVDGYVHSFNPADNSITEVLRSQSLWGQIWTDMVSDGTNLFGSRGYISSSQITNFYGGVSTATSKYQNNRGILKSTDDGATWNYMSLMDGLKFLFERHRAPMVRVRNEAHLFAGFGANDHVLLS